MSTKRYFLSCLLCRSEVTTNNFNKHYNSKQCIAGGKLGNIKQTKRDGSKQGKFKKHCSFCSILTTNKRHESLCDLNPNKQTPLNQFSHAKLIGIPYTIRQDTLDKLKLCNVGRICTNDQRENISNSMKIAVRLYPDSYRGRYNRGTVKEFICTNGFSVLGTWEYSFVEFCIINNIEIEQPKYSYSYEYDGIRSYFPDFFLPKFNSYVEVKGVKIEKDISKWDSLTKIHKKNLVIVDKRIIKDVKNNSTSIEYILNNFMY